MSSRKAPPGRVYGKNWRKWRVRKKPYLPKAAQRVSVDFCISTWNVEGKDQPEVIDKALTSLPASLCPDIVCLQETNLPTDTDGTENYKWLCSGTFGSAILIKKTTSIKPSSFEKLCDQICIVEITDGEDVTCKVISCYIPAPTDYRSEELWNKLQEALKEMTPKHPVILGGDFNAELGSDDGSKNLGSLGLGLFHKVSNENGVKLINMTRKAHLKIMSTYVKKSSHERGLPCYTFKEGNDKSQRDYIMMPFSQQMFLLKDVFNNWKPGYKHAIHSCKMSMRQFGEEANNVGALQNVPPTKYDLLVNTWNIGGATPAKVDSVLNELNLSIVCVQGLFLTSADDINTNNYNWYSSKKMWDKNVGIMVKISPDISVKNFTSVSEFLCSADIEYHGNSMKLVSCNLPVQGDPNHESVTTQLTDLVKSIDEDTHFILAGDFNIQTSKEEHVNKSSDENNQGSDPNTVYLNKLVAETNLCWKSNLWKQWDRRSASLLSQLTETTRGSPHHIIMSKYWKSKVHVHAVVRWIPYFENGILSLYITTPSKIFQFDGIKLNKVGDELSGTSEVVDGVIHKTKVFEVMENQSDDEEALPEKTNPLSQEDLDKFKTTPPSAEDLLRLLPDFVIFHKSNRWSSTLVIGPIYLLVNSFIAGNFGKLRFEDVEVMDKDPSKREKLICRIKWNGILLAEASDNAERVYAIRKKAVNKLLELLGQVSYTVKGKRSFFNKGYAPILMNDKKFADVIKVVEKTSVPTLPDVQKHIDEFFAAETYCELVFGPDFTKDTLQDIKSHAISKGLDYRFFALSEVEKDQHYIAVFKKYSPQELKERLLKEPEDPKYYLIPPSGIGVKYMDFLTKHEGQHLKDEHNVIQKYTSEMRKALAEHKRSTNNLDTKESKPEVPESKLPRKRGTTTQRFSKALSYQRSSRDQAQTERFQSNRLKRRVGGGRQTIRTSPWIQPLLQDRGQWQSPAWAELQPTRKHYDDDRRGRDYQEPLSAWFDEQNYREDRGDRGYENRRRDSYDTRQDYRSEDIGDRDYEYRQRDSYDTQQDYRSQDIGPSDSKRRRMNDREDTRLPRVVEPIWRDMAPLIMVWPITTNSQIEERAKPLLESNFPTEFIRDSQNRVAVVVSLPLRNGREKSYCLSIADSHNRAASGALAKLVKHCTTIKPNPTYLCNGSIPNFIRYKIPCQTNPRSYIIVDRRDTGPLTFSKVKEIFDILQASYNEDVFFDKDDYSYEEKKLLLDEAPHFNLKVRHFGDSPGIENHYICVYKVKPKLDIVEEVLKMRGFHTKYVMTTDRLPPSLSLNVF